MYIRISIYICTCNIYIYTYIHILQGAEVQELEALSAVSVYANAEQGLIDSGSKIILNSQLAQFTTQNHRRADSVYCTK